jgi:hypothetical protein
MATFRKYGGINHAQSSNIVRHNISNTKSMSFNTSGLYNSKETYLSHLDLSGNSLLGVGNIFFQDGSVLNTAVNVDPTFASLLSENNSAGNYGIENVNYIYGVTEIKFTDNTILTTAANINPTLSQVLINGNSANASINMTNHSVYNISQIEFNDNTIQTTAAITDPSLAYVLSKGNNGDNQAIIGVSNISVVYDVSANNLYATTNVIAGYDVSANNLYATTNVIAGYDVSATHNVYGTNIIASYDVSATHHVYGTNVIAINDVSATHHVYGTNIIASNDVSANNNVYGTNIIASYDVSANNNVYGTNIIASYDVSANNNVYGTDVIASHDISATHHVYGTNIIASYDVSATHHVYGTNLIAINDVSANNNVYGTDVIASHDISANNNVYGTNLIASGDVSTGTVSATSNITLDGTIDENGNGIASGTGGVKNTFSSLCKYDTAPTYTNDNDIPTKGYVDSIASGINPTESCVCATTETVNLSPASLSSSTIDGIPLQNDDRVLVKSQGSPSGNVSTSNVDNGIYVYNSGTNILSRATDCSVGSDVPNQVTFIRSGTLNKMTAFIQRNSDATVGTDPLKYEHFYSINYTLGQGLEISGGATLQVTSSLEFLKRVKIQNNSSGINNTPLSIGNSDFSKYIFFGSGLGNDAYSKLVESGDNGIFSAKTPGSAGNPLVISTWDDLSNGIRITDNSVKLQANSNNWYDLNALGHNFFGNMDLSGALTIGGTTGNTEFKQTDNGRTLRIMNNTAATSEISSFIFKCLSQTILTPSLECTPLAFDSQSFCVKAGDPSGGNTAVRYQVCSTPLAGYNTGHTFLGNCYFNNNIKLNTLGTGITFPDNTIQKSAASPSKTILYTSTQTITIPDNCCGFDAVIIGQGGPSGDSYYNQLANVYTSAGSGSGGNALTTTTKISYPVGTILQLTMTTTPTTGYSLLSVNGTNIMKVYNGSPGGSSPTTSGGLAGPVNTTPSEFDINVVNCRPISGTIGSPGFLSNMTSQLIPTTAGYSRLRNQFVDGYYGSGQLHVGMAPSYDIHPTSPLNTGALYITYYFIQ